MNEQLLKPCPFCGISTAPKLVEYCTKWYVCCDKRVGGCGADFDTFKTRLQAIDAWNKRADQSKDIDARIEQARLAEREACAVVCENGNFLHDAAPTAIFGKECARAIRARSAS